MEPATRHAGYHRVNPFLVVDDAEGLLSYLTAVFAATEVERILRPDGAIGHAEMRIGDTVIMISHSTPAFQARPSYHYAYVADVDAAYQRALAAGSTSISEPENKFYGNRECGVRDPFDNVWWIATLVEHVPAEQLQSRFDASQSS